MGHRLYPYLSFPSQHRLYCGVQALRLRDTEDPRLHPSSVVEEHNGGVTTYPVACRQRLTVRAGEIQPHDIQLIAILLLNPIHDGRGFRSRWSWVGEEEEERRAIRDINGGSGSNRATTCVHADTGKHAHQQGSPED
jgi:hypothetical protein